jgi:hypothetical protein
VPYVAVFTNSMVAVCVIGILSRACAAVVLPKGAVPIDVPVLVMLPASTSDCFIVYMAVHALLCDGAKVLIVHTVVDNLLSVTTILDNVTLPVLLTVYM